MKNKFEPTIAICLGIGFGLLYGQLFASLLWSNKLELILHDRLMQLFSSKIAPSEDILLVDIDKEIFFKPEIEDKQRFYARISHWFLEQKAGVVVLNFPHEWANNQINIIQKPSNNSIQNLIEKNILNKIVIIGFTEGDELDVSAMKSPFGEMIPGIEVEANLLSSLMTDSYYQTIPKLLEILIDLLGGAIIGGVIAFCTTRQCLAYLGLGMVGGYCILIVIAFTSGWMLPIVSPILTWIATAISIAVYLINIRLVLENERKQIQIAQEKAITSQAKKLMRRIWSNIHDDPLQELKVAMDDLELLSLPDRDREPILYHGATYPDSRI